MKHFKQISLSNNRLLLFVFIFLLSATLSAQVTIKEKVVIQPSIQRATSGITQNFQITANWDRAILGRIIVSHEEGVCGTYEFTGTGNITETIPQRTGNYFFELDLRIAEIEVGDHCTASMTIKEGQDTIFSGTCVEAGGGSDIWGGCLGAEHNGPYTRFKFNVVSDIYYESCGGFRIDKIRDCDSDDTWEPSRDEISVSIISGSEYVSFYNNNRQYLGNSVHGLTPYFDSLCLVANGYRPPDSGATVILQSESAGQIELDEVIIKPYYLKITTESSGVDFGNESLRYSNCRCGRRNIPQNGISGLSC